MSHSTPKRSRLVEVVTGQYPVSAVPVATSPVGTGQTPSYQLSGDGDDAHPEDDFMPVNGTATRRGKRRSDDDEVLGIVRSLLSKLS
jgi:hypothetical protein